MRLPLPIVLLRFVFLLSSILELTLALAVPPDSTHLSDQNLNVSLPFPQRFQVPGTSMFIFFYQFGPRLRYEDGDGLLKAAKQDSDFEVRQHSLHERIDGDSWAVDEPPLELVIKSLDPQAFPRRGGLMYGDLENAVMGLRRFFPWPWYAPGTMSSAYWGTKFDITVHRGRTANVRVGTGSLGYILETRQPQGAIAAAAVGDDYTSR